MEAHDFNVFKEHTTVGTLSLFAKEVKRKTFRKVRNKIGYLLNRSCIIYSVQITVGGLCLHFENVLGQTCTFL